MDCEAIHWSSQSRKVTLCWMQQTTTTVRQLLVENAAVIVVTITLFGLTIVSSSFLETRLLDTNWHKTRAHIIFIPYNCMSSGVMLHPVDIIIIIIIYFSNIQHLFGPKFHAQWCHHCTSSEAHAMLAKFMFQDICLSIPKYFSRLCPISCHPLAHLATALGKSLDRWYCCMPEGTLMSLGLSPWYPSWASICSFLSTNFF